jgi:hypothetical protein
MSGTERHRDFISYAAHPWYCRAEDFHVHQQVLTPFLRFAGLGERDGQSHGSHTHLVPDSIGVNACMDLPLGVWPKHL